MAQASGCFVVFGGWCGEVQDFLLFFKPFRALKKILFKQNVFMLL